MSWFSLWNLNHSDLYLLGSLCILAKAHFQKATVRNSSSRKVRYIKVPVHLQRTRGQHLCCLLLYTCVTLGTFICTKPAHWFFMVFLQIFFSGILKYTKIRCGFSRDRGWEEQAWGGAFGFSILVNWCEVLFLVYAADQNLHHIH